MTPQAPVQVNISSLTIVKVLLVVLGLVFVWAIRDIVGIVFVAWVLASALNPWINTLQRYHIPRSLGILSVYLLFLAVVTAIIVLLVPPVATELSSIAQNFPEYYSSLQALLVGLQQTGEQYGLVGTLQTTLDNAVQQFANISSGLYDTIASIFGGVAATIGVLVIAFYMTVEEDGIKKFLQGILPPQYQPYMIHKINQIQIRLSNWLWGQLILMTFIGVMVALAMWAIGVKYWLVLGLLAGLTEFIPIIGPIIATIPAILFAFTDFTVAPYKPFIVLIVFIVIQQLENQLLVPRIMGRAVGLNPIVVIIGLLIGAKLAGLVGMLLAIPLITIVTTFLDDFFTDREREINRLEQ